MEISIKSNKDIEELADEIISLSDITTSTSEVKAKIINLINDHLYHQIKNVTLSTIIKDQFEETEVPSVAEKATEKKEPVEEKPTPKPATNKEKAEGITPADIFGAAPESPKPEEKPAPQPTEPTIDTKEPLSQYEKLGEPTSGQITYNGNKYDFALKPIKSGAFAGQKALVVIYHIDPSDNQAIISNDAIYQNFMHSLNQLADKDMGQITSFYNRDNAMLFTITTKEKLNQYVNDLDEAVQLMHQAIKNMPSTQPAQMPAPSEPQMQMTQPATQPQAKPAPAPKTNSQGISLEKPF